MLTSEDVGNAQNHRGCVPPAIHPLGWRRNMKEQLMDRYVPFEYIVSHGVEVETLG